MQWEQVRKLSAVSIDFEFEASGNSMFINKLIETE